MNQLKAAQMLPGAQFGRLHRRHAFASMPPHSGTFAHHQPLFLRTSVMPTRSAFGKPRSLQLICMQSGRGTPASPPEKQAALARRPSYSPAPAPIYLDMTQVVNKQVITRTTGRNLGVVSSLWVDPARAEVVSLDLDERKKPVGSSSRVANIPLSCLTQVGDVILVHDEQVLFEQPMDGRLGFMILTGMEVRTRSGDFLGKVRDFSFNPDNGAIVKVIYDDFGLTFLPVNFFDTFSLPINDILSVGPGGIIVNDDSKYRERRESTGLFAAIPSLLRSINTGRSSTPMLDAYRQQETGYLPQGYSYEQWENDVRRWEQETGMSYEQYTRSQQLQQQQQQASLRAAQQPRRLAALPSPRATVQYPLAGQQQPQQQPMQPEYRAVQPQPVQQQYAGMQRYAQQPMPQDPRFKPNPAQDARFAPSPEQAWQVPAGMDPRQRSQQPGPAAGPSGRPPMQQGPMQQQPMQPMPKQPAQTRGMPSAAGGPAPGEPSGRRLDDWLEREQRPRMQEVLVSEAGPMPQQQGAAGGQPSMAQPVMSGGWPQASPHSSNGNSPSEAAGWDTYIAPNLQQAPGNTARGQAGMYASEQQQQQQQQQQPSMR